jgi:hypothetical protein
VQLYAHRRREATSLWPRISRVDPQERIYRGLIRLFSLGFVALGFGILIITLVNGGGALSVGTLLALAFLAVGIGRLWVASRT